MKELSKSQFKPKALEIMRNIEQAGESILITDHGKPVLEIKPYTPVTVDPLKKLKGSAVEYLDPLEPIDVDDWESGN